MTQEIPKIFTRKDIPRIGGGDTVAGAANPAGFSLDDADKILDFGDRVEKLFERAAKTLLKVKREEKDIEAGRGPGPGFGDGGREPGGQEPDFQGAGFYSEDGQRLNVVDSTSRTVEESEMKAEPATGSVGATNGQITAPKIYKVALGAMAKLLDMDAEMTVAQALEMGRENKKMVLEAIEKELVDMASPD